MSRQLNTTLIIHGPISIHTMSSLYRYRDEYNIIISTPRVGTVGVDAIVDEIMKMVKSPDFNISAIFYDPTVKAGYNNDQHRWTHFFSVILALEACSTEYVIKMRSDEVYSNISPLEAAMMKYPNKIITTDVFFRNAKMPFHPADHLLGGKTEFLLEVYHQAKAFCEDTEQTFLHPLIKKVFETMKVDKAWLASEQYFGVATISCHTTANKLKDVDPVQSMIDSFHIVSTKELGAIRIAVNSAKSGNPTEYTDTSYFNKDTDIGDIQEYK